MKNKLKLMISKKVADRSHFGSNIESLLYRSSRVRKSGVWMSGEAGMSIVTVPEGSQGVQCLVQSLVYSVYTV